MNDVSSTAVKLTADNWEKEVVQSEVPVLVDFGAAWCPPCKAIAPIVDALAVEYAGRAKVATVDIDEAPELADRFGIQSVPTLAVFRGGLVVDSRLGAAPKAVLAAMLDGALAGQPVPVRA